MRISSYGCTWEVWRARDFPSASITQYTHAKSMNQLFYNIALIEIYDEKSENPGDKRKKNR